MTTRITIHYHLWLHVLIQSMCSAATRQVGSELLKIFNASGKSCLGGHNSKAADDAWSVWTDGTGHILFFSLVFFSDFSFLGCVEVVRGEKILACVACSRYIQSVAVNCNI